MALLAIQELNLDAILSQIDLALESNAPAEHLAEFVASVDWSGVTETTALGSLLAEIELTTDAFVENEITVDQYRDELRAVTLRERPGSIVS